MTFRVRSDIFRSDMLKQGILICSILIWPVVGTAFAGTCTLSRSEPYKLQSDNVSWTMEIVGGGSCIRGLRYGAILIDAVKLVSRPRIGQVTLMGSGFTYVAKSQFQGRDSFELEVSGRTPTGPGTSTILVTVSVR
jgi:hypothetical protein